MEWYWALAALMGSFFVFIIIGLPIVFAFFGVNLIFVAYFMGSAGFDLLIDGVYSSLSVFVLLPITLFILMGEVMFRTDVATRMISTLDTWLSAVPGRLSLLAIGSGTLMAAFSGTSIGTAAMLTRTLAPTMEEKGYNKNLTIAPLLGSGGLAIMIPPSGLAVILAVIATVSVGKLLVAIVIPGLVLALSFLIYVIGTCVIDPTAAPKYTEERVSLGERLVLTVKYILPLSLLVFLVIGVIFLGVATPTEAAALGTMGAFFLGACYGRLTWSVVYQSLLSTVRISVMVLAILAASQTFTQLLAYTGATSKLVEFAINLPIEPIWVIILMHLVTLILGGPIGGIPLIMITIPVFMPVVLSLGYDPIWFCVAMLINVELAQITPPFGILLYVVRGIMPRTTMGMVTRAAIPIIICNLLVMGLVIAFPEISLWLPSMMAN